MTAVPVRRDLTGRIADGLSSPLLNAVIGIAGIAVPVVAWISETTRAKNTLFAVETVLVLLLVANHVWLRRAYISLRRANSREMADRQYFDRVRTQLENELIADFGEIADGHLQVYASEVPRLSVLLYKVLIECESEPRRVLAADLTVNPDLLTQRREYLAVNRRLVETGGTIQRLFITRASDLAQEVFATALLQLINHHRALGVQCGIAVRDRLRADQAIDFVVVSGAAVLVEEEQGDAEYTRGRSSVYFKQVDRWTGRFESIWGHGTTSAPFILQSYEAAVRPMLDGGGWDAARARAVVNGL
ncbi:MULTISPECIES: hypothetical protein [unclassified Streptomyces]|uniref:hypothetical protein n=1 Tax=unclassified Streptomyces TaxID=2593676 RepID=UPI0038223830